MKRYSFILFLMMSIFTYNISFGQMFGVPESKPLEISPPKKGKSMEYRFPNNVTKELESIILKDSDNFWFINMKISGGDTVSISLYTIHERPDKIKGDVGVLLSSTNRHLNIGKTKIPIVLLSDYRFSFPRFVITDGYIVIFVANKWYDDAQIIYSGY